MKEFINRILGLAGYRIVRLQTVPELQGRIDELYVEVSELRDEFSRRRNEIGRLQDENTRFMRANHDLQPVFSDIYGHVMHVDSGDAGLRLGGLCGAKPEYGEAGYIVRNTRPGQTAIDIGANIGLFTLLLGRCVSPSGRVIAFEPGPKSYALLLKNIGVNGYRNIRPENAAVADRCGQIDLFICRTGESDNRIADVLSNDEGWDRMPTRCVQLDNYLASNGIGAVDFIKLDVQGAEMLALRGMEKTLRANPQIQMVVEYAPDGLAAATPTQLLSFLTRLGFRLFNLTEGHDEQPVTAEWLLANIGNPGQQPQTNLVVRRN